MKINFVDLKRQYESIRGEANDAIGRVLERGDFILGEDVKKFEEEFSAYCGVKHAIGVDSGTSALHLALLALGVKPGDEVITVPNTFIATALAVSMAGARIKFVEIDEESYNMNPLALEKAVTKKTKVILPVHLYGQPADMKPIKEIAEKHGVKVLEDSCQAHGAEYRGKRTGGLGDAACFSFYPAKNLGCYGDGGMITTNDDKVAESVMMLRNYGQKQKYVHLMKGYNNRLDSIQAAVLRVKLRRLDGWNDARRRNAKLYSEMFNGSKVVTPVEMDYARHVYHLYVIRCANRDELGEKLKADGISTVIHYPIPIHLQGAYADLGLGKGSFRIAEKCAEEIISLPMFPELTEEEIGHVVEKVKSYAK